MCRPTPPYFNQNVQTIEGTPHSYMTGVYIYIYDPIHVGNLFSPKEHLGFNNNIYIITYFGILWVCPPHDSYNSRTSITV